MNNREILAPGIILYKTDIGRVNSIMNQIEPALSDKWNVAKGVNTDTHLDEVSMARKCYDYPISEEIMGGNSELMKNLYLDTDMWISECVKDYRTVFMHEEVVGGPYIYLKYEDSDKFDAHIDDGKKYPRTVSVSAYLNDNYDGGEIEFPHFGILYKPNAGDVIVFGSSFPYLHKVHPTKNGTRYAIVNWYRYVGYPMIME